MKAFYEDKWVSVYHGDCREVMRDLDRVDVVIADPPYAATRLSWDHWPTGWVQAVHGVSDVLWCFGSLGMFWCRFQEFAGWRLAQEIVWEKQNGSGLHVDRFRRVHELAVQFYDAGVKWKGLYKKPVMTMDARARRVRRQAKPSHWGQLASAGTFEVEENGPRLMRSVIYERSTHRRCERETQKPEGIVLPLVEYSCPPGGVVLDPCCGTGTTLVAAKRLRRRSIGIDVDVEACRIAVRRVRDLE